MCTHAQRNEGGFKEKVNQQVISYNYALNAFQALKLEQLVNDSADAHAFLFELEPAGPAPDAREARGAEDTLKAVLRAVADNFEAVLNN